MCAKLIQSIIRLRIHYGKAHSLYKMFADHVAIRITDFLRVTCASLQGHPNKHYYRTNLYIIIQNLIRILLKT